jgi:hypothetical protein
VTVASSIRHVPRRVVGVTNLECVGRRSARRREPDPLWAMIMNTDQSPKRGDRAPKFVPTELKRCAARRGAVREAENVPVLLRAATGSL